MRRAAVLLALGTLGCSEFDQLFVRESPVVNDAIAALRDKQQKQALEILTRYLETGACEAGVIGAGERARRLGDASLDLGLALAGAYPRPSADAAAAPSPSASAPAVPSAAPPSGLPGGEPPAVDPEVSARIDCALRVLSPIAENGDLGSDLRARAHYLMGNLELSRSGFQAAIDAYDRAIVLAPGLPENAGDAIGRDIARNRALAQRRLQEEEERKKQEAEQKQQSQDDQQSQDQQDQGDQDQQDQDDQQSQDQKDQGDQKDQDDQQSQDQKDQDDQQSQDQKDPGEPEQQPGDQPSAGDQNEPEEAPQDGDDAAQAANQGQQNAPAASQDARILDRLEQAPTLQQHDAKQKARTLRLRPTMEDK